MFQKGDIVKRTDIKGRKLFVVIRVGPDFVYVGPYPNPYAARTPTAMIPFMLKKVVDPEEKTNREGLTWAQWRDAARVAAPVGLSPGLIKGWRKEWMKGTDPTEMGGDEGGSNRRVDLESLEVEREIIALKRQMGFDPTDEEIERMRSLKDKASKLR